MGELYIRNDDGSFTPYHKPDKGIMEGVHDSQIPGLPAPDTPWDSCHSCECVRPTGCANAVAVKEAKMEEAERLGVANWRNIYHISLKYFGTVTPKENGIGYDIDSEIPAPGTTAPFCPRNRTSAPESGPQIIEVGGARFLIVGGKAYPLA